jgi:hypothetical protein
VEHCYCHAGHPRTTGLSVLGQPHSTQQYQREPPNNEAALTQAIVQFTSQYGRYGYRQVTGLLRNDSWLVNYNRVERIWRREGLKVPKKQPPRRRLWLTDGSCIRLRVEHPNHVWACDFMATRTEDGRPMTLLTDADEYTLECLAIDLKRRLRSDDMLYRLPELFVQQGVRNTFALIMARVHGQGRAVLACPSRRARRCLSRRAVRGRTVIRVF